MSSINRDINKINNPLHRGVAWAVALLLAGLFGTMAWLMVLVFFVLGATGNHFLELNLPAWAGWFALIGLPLGAWLEIRTIH